MATRCLPISSAAVNSTSRPVGRARLTPSCGTALARPLPRCCPPPVTHLFGRRHQPGVPGKMSASVTADRSQVRNTSNGADREEGSYLSGRLRQVSQHFPSALGVDDFIARMEIALRAYGFQDSNTIACSNLCRDEVTYILKQKLDAVFGSSFNTNGLGGVLTCGVTGLKAGLSHAPQAADTGRERYVFFSFPHIAVDATGEVGSIGRPGRPGPSKACGALVGALGDIKGTGLAPSCVVPGEHEARDPEYSILKQRLARRLRYEGADEEEVQDMSLVDMTTVAERTITDDLEFLISKSVDPSNADYAVVTGVQIHNWGAEYDDSSPNLEFVAPASVYVVVGGERTYLDLSSIPPMTPRQIEMITLAGGSSASYMEALRNDVCGSAGGVTTLRAIDAAVSYNPSDSGRQLRAGPTNYEALVQQGEMQMRDSSTWPSWQSKIRAARPFKKEGDNSTVDDETELAKPPAASSFRLPSEKEDNNSTADDEIKASKPSASSFRPPSKKEDDNSTADDEIKASKPAASSFRQPSEKEGDSSTADDEIKVSKPAASSFRQLSEKEGGSSTADGQTELAKPAASSFRQPSEKESEDEMPQKEPEASPSQPQAVDKTMDAPAPQPQAPVAASPNRNPRTSSAGGDGDEGSYLSGRLFQVSQHFPTALGVDDFISRMEIALRAYDFKDSNTIACCNLCRDEVTFILKQKLDAVFGSSFNTNGLGGVLTCGVTGFGAGLSHAPQAADTGRERYVFFSFPHIAIDATGEVGSIGRPGRPGPSKACGALVGALGDIKGSGLAPSCSTPGEHEARDPEYSILKQRLARRLRYEGAEEEEVQDMSLVDMTTVAERTITDDLEFLISKSVDPSKADYAVVTGVQIHNWGAEFDDSSPNLEFVAPASVYVVVNGERTYLDLQTIPPMTPRQIEMLTAAAGNGASHLGRSKYDVSGSAGGVTTLRAIDAPYPYNSRQTIQQTTPGSSTNFQQLVQREEQQAGTAGSRPSWQGKIRAGAPFKKEGDNSTYEEMGDGGSDPARPVASQPARPAKPAGSSFYEVDPWTQMGH